MDKFRGFKERIDRKINVMEAKLSYMNDGLKGFQEALTDFKDEFDSFIEFSAENYSDHEKRIAALEKRKE